MNFTAELLDLMNAAYSVKEPPRFPISASAAGNCPRRLSMLLKGEPHGDLSVKSARVLEDGTYRGIALAKRLAAQAAARKIRCELEREIWTEIPCNDSGKIEFAARDWLMEHAGLSPEQARKETAIRAGHSPNAVLVRGRADVLLYLDEHLVHLIDFKGKASYGMKMLPTEGPGAEYETQLWFYKLGLEREGVRVASATLFYENKDNQDWLPLDVDISGAPPPQVKRTMMELGQMLDAFGSGNFTGLEGTPLHALEALVELRAKGKAALPWQCRWCSVGPERGKCVGTATITVKETKSAMPELLLS